MAGTHDVFGGAWATVAKDKEAWAAVAKDKDCRACFFAEQLHRKHCLNCQHPTDQMLMHRCRGICTLRAPRHVCSLLGKAARDGVRM